MADHKVLAQLSEEELKELIDFKHQDNAIYKMLEKLVSQQHQLEAKEGKWFETIREKYKVDPEAKITILHSTGEVIEEQNETK